MAVDTGAPSYLETINAGHQESLQNALIAQGMREDKKVMDANAIQNYFTENKTEATMTGLKGVHKASVRLGDAYA